MPENIFPVSDDVFVVVSKLKKIVLVHIRRYKKYGDVHYPTKEGITLSPSWFDHLFARGAPSSENSTAYLVPDDLKISSEDSLHVKLSSKDCSITITQQQWNIIQEQRAAITSVILDVLFGDVDFFTAFQDCSEGPLYDKLPSSLDVSAGIKHVSDVLLNVICEQLIGKNALIMPEYYDDFEVVSTNSVTDFNSFAMDLSVHEIARAFYDALWTPTCFLALVPGNYVTSEFLKNVDLSNYIREARCKLCPPCFE